MAAHRKKTAEHHHAAPAHTGGARRGRPTWSGHLRLSLVSCPVALYGATTRTADVSFHLLNPETNNRIRMVPTDPDTGPVERKDLVKGYEIEKNKYVIVTNEELQSVRLETTKTIDIERFVDADEIDRLYWNDPYFLLPDGKTGAEAYVVIRDALAETGRIAIGRVVMHTRERMVALEPRDKGIVAYTLRAEDEVLSAKHAFADIPSGHASKEMVQIAEKIIDQKEGDFDPAMFQDRYEKALKELIRAKQKGHKPVRAEPVEDTNVVDLMEALKRSLKGKAAAPRAHANSNARPKKRAHR
ncbi:MAG: Ku protein [Alphaproteobacteria bacterium]|nr:Ku protein [Alphaproteobacteria bacterium]MBL6939415.1 Ku protein [Alphaproteobacteria bacterium]MBL7097104.1 Ku protein [Alphaproteobacteria bacterium]